MSSARPSKSRVGEPAPALIRQGIYTTLGALLLAGAGTGVLLLLRPVRPAKSAGCGCGCGGSKSGAQGASLTAQGQVYG